MGPLPGEVWMVRDADVASTDKPHVFLDAGALVLVLASPRDGYVLCLVLGSDHPHLVEVVEAHVVDRVHP